jgi:hypothetical protein
MEITTNWTRSQKLKTLWIFVMFLFGLGIIISGFVTRIVPSDPNDPAVQSVGKHFQINKGYFGLLLHLIGGSIALIIGPFQFWQFIRQNNIRAHRIMGRIYGVGIIMGAIGSIWLQPFIVTGVLVNHFALGFLALMWLITLTFAIYYIKYSKRMDHIEKHRQWMIRNMALTLSAVTFRLWLFFLIGCAVATGLDFPTALATVYPSVGWLSWVPNLMIAEYYIIFNDDNGK